MIMEKEQLSEERMEEIYLIEKEAINKDFNTGDDCNWFSCVRTRLFLINNTIEIANMSKKLSDKTAESYKSLSSEIVSLVEYYEKKDFKKGEVDFEAAQEEVLNKIVELRYELEQSIL